MSYRLLSLSEAKQYYSRFPGDRVSPYHHPEYVYWDAIDKGNAEAIFFFYENQQGIYYHPLHKINTELYCICDLESARGYGGPVTTIDDPLFLDLAENAYQQFIDEHDISVEFIRFSPLLAYQASIYKGETWYDRDVRLIDLTDYDIDRQENRSRGAIKKASSMAYEFHYHDNPAPLLIDQFMALYRKRMAEISATTQYCFTDNYFIHLLSANASLAWLSHQGQMVAASMLLESTDIIEYHLSCSTDTARKTGATNLLLHQVAMKFRNQKKFFHLGGGNDSKPDNSLLLFKKGVGQLRQEFRIGKRIHNPTLYQQLKKQLHIESTPRVIFYRD